VAEVKRLGLGERLRLMAEQKEMIRRDLWAFKETLRQEGREEGRQEGLEEGQRKGREEGRQALLKTARKLRDMGLPVEQIAQATGLSPEAVRGGK
jgi:predicted transposase/invertase (TIGR01784 family)